MVCNNSNVGVLFPSALDGKKLNRLTNLIGTWMESVILIIDSLTHSLTSGCMQMRMILGGEVDCITESRQAQKALSPNQFVELKTNMVINSDKGEVTFEKFKMLKIYMVSFSTLLAMMARLTNPRSIYSKAVRESYAAEPQIKHLTFS